MTSTTLIRFKCNRCKKEIEIPKEGQTNSHLTETWTHIVRTDLVGGIKFGYHLCDECSDGFLQWINELTTTGRS